MEKKFNSMIALNLKSSASIHTVTSGYLMFSSILVVQFTSNQSLSVCVRNRNKSCSSYEIEDKIILLYLGYQLYILHI